MEVDRNKESLEVVRLTKLSEDLKATVDQQSGVIRELDRERLKLKSHLVRYERELQKFENSLKNK